ncbi:hypothetical protein, partial [Ruminococcus sp.]|uniref:hypothetical protein n=1 Tax=Ruminococcus sp. TaxID=41978 RepID=UPI0025EE9B16
TSLAIFCICRMNLVSAFIIFTLLYFSRFWLAWLDVKLMTLSCSPRLEKAAAFSHHPLHSAKECAGVFRRLRTATRASAALDLRQLCSAGPACRATFFEMVEK